MRAPLTTSVEHVALEAAGLAERVLPGTGRGRSPTIWSRPRDVVEVERQEERAHDRDQRRSRHEDAEPDHGQAVARNLRQASCHWLSDSRATS